MNILPQSIGHIDEILKLIKHNKHQEIKETQHVYIVFFEIPKVISPSANSQNY